MARGEKRLKGKGGEGGRKRGGMGKVDGERKGGGAKKGRRGGGRRRSVEEAEEVHGAGRGGEAVCTRAGTTGR